VARCKPTASVGRATIRFTSSACTNS
jgi:hypothetical protein